MPNQPENIQPLYTKFSLKRLKKLYETKWPYDADELIQFIASHATNQGYKDILQSFKSYINDRNAVHPNRYKRKWQFLDAYWLTETQAFIELNKKLDEILSTIPTSEKKHQKKMLTQKTSSISFTNMMLGASFFLLLKSDSRNALADSTDNSLCAPQLDSTHAYLGKQLTTLDYMFSQKNFYDDAYHLENNKLCLLDKTKNRMQDHLLFLKNNVGLRVMAISDTEDFKSINNLWPSKDFGYKRYLETVNLVSMTSQLPADERAKLIVAATFNEEIHIGSSNWGLDKNGLVILHAETKMLTDMVGYLYHGLAVFRQNTDSIFSLVKPVGHNLSKENIEEIKKIYQTMLEKARSDGASCPYLSQQEYIHLLNMYIRICDETLKSITSNLQAIFAGKLHLEINSFMRSNAKNDINYHSKNKVEVKEDSKDTGPKYYKGMQIRNVTGNVTKTYEKPGGASEGQVCVIEEKTYYMKVSKTDGVGKLLNEYNLRLIKNMGVIVPNTQFMYLNGKYYFASEAVDKFTKASDITEGMKFKDDLAKKEFFTNEVIKRIGEDAVAKIMTASLYVEDLYNKQNWGYNSQGLVIIDADKSPNTVEGYFREGARRLWTVKGANDARDMGMILSLEDVKKMKAIHQHLLNQNPPQFHEEVDLSREEYTAIVSNYIEACERTIHYIQTNLPDIDPNTRAEKINIALADSIKEVAKEYDNNKQYTIVETRRPT